MTIGVVVVTYGAEDVIADCLESLMASRGVDLRIVVVDNASQDGTVRAIRDWAAVPQAQARAGRPFDPVPHGPVPLVEDAEAIRRLSAGEVGLVLSGENKGFAGGVNLGIEALRANPGVDHFWVLNPDCMTPEDTPAKLEARARAEGRYGVIGGRIYYCEPMDMIQNDGGRVNGWTGTCLPFNLGAVGRDTPSPPDGTLDYACGAHMLVSRDFLEVAGLMPETYFLYYEEIDWCMRRGGLPLLMDVDAAVHHHGGASIGSATLRHGPSPLSAYFMTRARMIFMRRHRPLGLPVALGYVTLKALRALLRGQGASGVAALRGAWGLKPSDVILKRIGRASLP